MPTKKKHSEPPWQMILEDIRSQNRATIEAVETSRESLEARFDEHECKTGARFDTLEAAVKSLSSDVRANREAIQGNRARIEELDRSLSGRMDALENALNRVDQESRARDASLEMAIRELKVSVQQGSVDLRDLAAKVTTLARLEERVAALEQRSA